MKKLRYEIQTDIEICIIKTKIICLPIVIIGVIIGASAVVHHVIS